MDDTETTSGESGESKKSGMRGRTPGESGSNAIISDLMTPEVRADPYPLYATLHELGPASAVYENLFIVNGYDEVNAVLRNPGFGKWSEPPEPGSGWEGHASLDMVSRGVLDLNPPDHTRVKRLMTAVFTPRRIGGLAPAITSMTEALLDTMAQRGADGQSVDFMDEFAFRLPVSVICELLGVPEADRYRFRSLVRDLTAAFDLIEDPALLIPADTATAELTEYFTALVAERRAAPRDDMISALVQEADAADGNLSREELYANLILLLLAGFETTTNLLGNGLVLLFDRPETAAGLRAGTVRVEDFIEEALRFDPPVQLTGRTALIEGLEVAGTPVPPKAQVLVLIGAANRDPARFADPGVFDPSRPDNQPVSFGAGGHFCIGAALARLEAATAFSLLLRRFPRLAAAEGEERIRGSRLVLRGYQTLPLAVA